MWPKQRDSFHVSGKVINSSIRADLTGNEAKRYSCPCQISLSHNHWSKLACVIDLLIIENCPAQLLLPSGMHQSKINTQNKWVNSLHCCYKRWLKVWLFLIQPWEADLFSNHLTGPARVNTGYEYLKEFYEWIRFPRKTNHILMQIRPAGSERTSATWVEECDKSASAWRSQLDIINAL